MSWGRDRMGGQAQVAERLADDVLQHVSFTSGSGHYQSQGNVRFVPITDIPPFIRSPRRRERVASAAR
jgi:hypothetical protein